MRPGLARRGGIGVGIAIAALLVGGTVGSVTPAGAAHAGSLLLGHGNSVAGLTTLANTATTPGVNGTGLEIFASTDPDTNFQDGLYAKGFGGGDGVEGDADGSGDGVNGEANGSGDGVEGLAEGAGVGVRGRAFDSFGVYGTGNTRVYGESDDVSGAGVWGQATVSGGTGVFGEVGVPGFGVWGRAFDPAGIGVLAESSAGTALKVDGVATFTRSGLVIAVAGQVAKGVTGVSLTTASMVFAPIQGTNTANMYVTGVVTIPSQSKFVINFNQAVPAGKTLKIAWFVLN